MKKLLMFAVVLICLMPWFIGCSNDIDEQSQKSVETRLAVMDRASVLYPAPTSMVNFPQRQLLIEYTLRQDLVNHPWYTYIMGDNGAITHYFVSTTMPISTNAFLGNTDTLAYDKYDHEYKTSAPSLDGMYYGGSGSTSSMNGWIFKDAATGAMGVVYGMHILTLDHPLLLQTEPQLIRIAPADKK